MMVTKFCPHCKKTTTCVECEATKDFCDDMLEVDTDYICTKCDCYFSEKQHYTIHYEDTEIEIINDGKDE